MNPPSLPQVLRTRRTQLRLDQRNLAEIAGISPHSLSDIESGKGNPTLLTLTRLCDALGLEISLRVREPASQLETP